MKRQEQVLGVAAVAGLLLLLLLKRGGDASNSGSTVTVKPTTRSKTSGSPDVTPTQTTVVVEPSRSSGLKGWLALGAGLGWALWFFGDPQQGHTRRQKVRAAGERAWQWTRARLPTSLGGVAQPSGDTEGQSWMPDRLLRDQLLQALSGIMPNPRKLQLQVKKGLVRVSGVLPADLHEQVLRCIHEVPGVVEVDADLQAG